MMMMMMMMMMMLMITIIIINVAVIIIIIVIVMPTITTTTSWYWRYQPCNSFQVTVKQTRLFQTYTLQEINMSHLGKRKIIFKMPFLGDMLVPWRVVTKNNDVSSFTHLASPVSSQNHPGVSAPTPSMLESFRRLEGAEAAKKGCVNPSVYVNIKKII